VIILRKKTIALIVVSVAFLTVCNHYQEKKQDKALKTIIADQNIQYVTEIHKNKEDVQIPNTKYELLKNEIHKQIAIYRNEFAELLTTDEQSNQEYTLFITYEEYTYNNYISYIFFIEMFAGGAHPNHKLFTITYDIENNKIFTFEDLQTKYPELLNRLSEYSRHLLIRDSRVDIDMLDAGTEPKKDNFEHFVLTKEGIKIFFDRYQIAPYVSGQIDVVVPYSHFN